MENSLCGDEYHLKLGNHATIDMIKEDDESDDDGGNIQEWNMTYSLYGSSCTLYLEKYLDEHDKINKGPDRHPSSALFYMFEEVCRSGSWRPTSCPHCAGEARDPSSEIMPRDDINNNNLVENIDFSRLAISLHTELAKSINLVQHGNTPMVSSTNQYHPSNLHQSCGGSSSQQVLALRNPNFPTRVPQHDARVNRRLELIDNKDINGNGNAVTDYPNSSNRLHGEDLQQQQFFEFSDPEANDTAVPAPTVAQNDVVNDGRPVRQRALPHRLRDYERFQDNEVNNDGDFVHFALMAESEPVNEEEALSDPKWICAMKDELESIEKNDT
ncbi:hypothetical protein KIW84_011132 [Lathyrus oleraceus]|uniref:Uncharacterized protein n=1 Tax=Pisum sativum TaxID=3888 RepID=A0A9D5BEI8_PEA|nr:hypothetical protein KIW84_011132 [Pisum sativum]